MRLARSNVPIKITTGKFTERGEECARNGRHGKRDNLRLHEGSLSPEQLRHLEDGSVVIYGCETSVAPLGDGRSREGAVIAARDVGPAEGAKASTIAIRRSQACKARSKTHNSIKGKQGAAARSRSRGAVMGVESRDGPRAAQRVRERAAHRRRPVHPLTQGAQLAALRAVTCLARAARLEDIGRRDGAV